MNFLNSCHFFMERDSLDVVAVPEHDVVPVGAIHVHVDLPDVRGESSGSGLQLLQVIQEMVTRSSKASKAFRPKSDAPTS